MDSMTLYNGVDIPILGYRAESEKDLFNMMEAIKFGYRLFEINPIWTRKAGSLIAKSGVLRHELFLTSQVTHNCHGYRDCQDIILKTLKNLQTEYLDLVLLEDQSQLGQKWQALEEFYEEGILRAIGIYSAWHDLSSERIAPMISDYKNDKEKDTMLMIRIPSYLDHEELAKIAATHHKTMSQIMIRWALQQRAVSMITSGCPRELVENQNIYDFCLNENEMNKIDLMYWNKIRKETGENEKNYYIYSK